MKIVPFTLYGLNSTWNAKTSPFAARNIKGSTIVQFALHALIKLILQLQCMLTRLLAAWVNKTVPPAMHGLVKFSIHFLLHGLTHHLRVHRTDYRNCSVYTVRNINVLFTQHGLPKVNFNLYRMAITELFHITFRFHCTDYRNCSVSTARKTIVPFTPHGLPNDNFHLHRMEITKSPYHFPFSPHVLPTLLRLHRT